MRSTALALGAFLGIALSALGNSGGSLTQDASAVKVRELYKTRLKESLE